MKTSRRSVTLLLAIVATSALLAGCDPAPELGDPGSCDVEVPGMSVLSGERSDFLKSMRMPVWEAVMGMSLVEGMPSFGDTFAEVWIDPQDGLGVVVAAVKEATFDKEDRQRVEALFANPQTDLRIDLVSYSRDDLDGYVERLWEQAPPADTLWTSINGRTGHVIVGTDEHFTVAGVPAEALCWQFDDRTLDTG